MGFCFYLLLLSVISGSHCWSDNRQRRFRDDFLFGAASAAYQVEGGWDADGKGESIWDRYFHEHPEAVSDGSNGDIACDSYHHIRRDVEMLRELGVDFYRFSVSWPRVLPTGLPNNKNEKGLEYYDSLIDELLKYNIEPMITLYHFDLPQTLQDLGGWANPLVSQWFEDYARVLFERYASKVKYWITINQPNICMDSYGNGYAPPSLNSKGIGDYLCVKNILVAHAKVYRLYDREYRSKYKGSVGISIAVNWYDPLNNDTENVRAAEEYREFNIGLFMNPIWSKEGDFPRLVRDIVAKRSKEEGYPISRLPRLSSEEISLLKGSADFLGMNHYTTFYVRHAPAQAGVHFPDTYVELTQGSQWKPSQSSWLKSVPYGLYKACLYINKQYDYPTLYITEHGWSTAPGLKDPGRVDNLKGYLSALLLAVEDGTVVKGYTAWSLMDNLEWTAGFSERFGLYEVDFESEGRTRTARQSAFFYKSVIDSRIVNEEWKPKKNSKMQVSESRNKETSRVEL